MTASEQQNNTRLEAVQRLVDISRTGIPISIKYFGTGEDYTLYQLYLADREITEIVSIACGFPYKPSFNGLRVVDSDFPEHELKMRILQVVAEQVNDGILTGGITFQVSCG